MKIISLIYLALITACASKNPMIIAHRGASSYLPEHTLASYAMAHAFDVDFIEPDVVMTRDKQLIVLHDLTLDATTNVREVFPGRSREDGKNYVIDFTLPEIKTLRVNDRVNLKNNKPKFPRRFPVNYGLFSVPTFEEFLQLIEGLNQARGKSIGIFPEIKAPAFFEKEGYDIVGAVIKMLRKYKYEEKPEQIFIQSFDPKALKRLKLQYKTKIPLIQLLAENNWGMLSGADYDYLKSDEGLASIKKYAVGVGVWIPKIMESSPYYEKELAENIVKNKLLFNVYTLKIKDPKSSLASLKRKFKKLKSLGYIDGIYSDFSDIGFLK